MAYVTGGRNPISVESAVNRLDWNPKLADTFLEGNTFYSLIEHLGMGRHATKNPTYHWGEYEETIATVTPTDTTTTTITGVATGCGLIKDDVLYCPTAASSVDEYVIVTTTPATTATSVSCLRLTSSGTANMNGDVYNGKPMYKV
ncbi:MAG: hypothetical protein D4S01_01315, partial [Dehalococcoidia bacterium]